MSREPIRHCRSFQTSVMQQMLLWGISRRFHRLSPCDGQVAHVLRTLPPVAANVLLHRAAPRLACVKPAASVHPEPGSNSSLYIKNSLSLTLTVFSRNWRSRSLFFSVLATCTFLNLSMNSIILRPFRASISDPHLATRSPFQSTRVSNGIAKVDTFFELPNFSHTFFHFFSRPLKHLTF